ncbi:MAG: hypothetical protein JO327_01905 [Nitrososphaeraceae archaeon]|nr:hypothetical protein [Nitrososphaeraceae archaeon]
MLHTGTVIIIPKDDTRMNSIIRELVGYEDVLKLEGTFNETIKGLSKH